MIFSVNCVIDVYASVVMKTLIFKKWWSVVIMSSVGDAWQQCLRRCPWGLGRGWVEHCKLSVSHDVMSAQCSHVGLFDEPKIS